MNAEESIKSTPLCDKHVALGAKMVPFAGWNMPVQYAGILAEHNAVRTDCGVFDISHMGQFLVSGEGAMEWLNGMFTNNLNKMAVSAFSTSTLKSSMVCWVGMMEP